ncbi:Dot/Icm type IV secretion system effector CoxH3 [Simiduia litorea]|uniref:alpha/beta hydrolase n=1 Tax=Simiduia litorea TaxID=1435348 RepID=UPI0036F34175
MFNLKETTLLIQGPAGDLELLTQRGDDQGALRGAGYLAVIAHPHPVHGGNMSNKVVSTLARVYRQLGIDSVRFNFRGVGNSQGSFDQGRGELEDFLTVCDWAQQQLPTSGLLLAGFSFGSAVAAAASFVVPSGHLILVAPPVERYAYDKAGAFSQPVAVAIGEQDELVGVAGLKRWFDGLSGNKQLLVIPETGHFFHGQLTELKDWLVQQLVLVLDQSAAGGTR